MSEQPHTSADPEPAEETPATSTPKITGAGASTTAGPTAAEQLADRFNEVALRDGASPAAAGASSMPTDLGDE